MKGKIAIEPNMTRYSDYLTSQGFAVHPMPVEDMTAKNMRGYDAFVISGMSENFLGFEDTQTKAPLINAKGLSPEDVSKMIGTL